MTDDAKPRAQTIEFKRAMRDCDHNRKIVQQEDRRLARGKPRGDRRKSRPIFDYLVVIDGEDLGSMERKAHGRGYRFLDLGGLPIEHPDHGRSVVSRDLFEPMVRAALAAGLVPSVAAVLIRHGIEPASVIGPSAG